MITLDTSVAVKWFEPGERFEAEAREILRRIDRREVDVAANEIISLEVVRALQGAQARPGSVPISDAHIERAFARLDYMFHAGAMLECPVKGVLKVAKDALVILRLFTADAIHLATSIYPGSSHLVVDDNHFLSPPVIAYATKSGVKIMRLPDFLAERNPANGSAAQ